MMKMFKKQNKAKASWGPQNRVQPHMWGLNPPFNPSLISFILPWSAPTQRTTCSSQD